MLTGKKIVLGISGGIAAYKCADVASRLAKLNADCHVVMTEHAKKIITPEPFRVLTKNQVYTDVFDDFGEEGMEVPHISLGTSADVILIAPATANVIGKLAHGIADDMLTTMVLPARCPILLAPAMNVYMYENPVVQENLEILKKRGYTVIEPVEGHLACGYDGKGKLPAPEDLVEAVLFACEKEKDLVGKKFVVSAGPTREALDPVRYITNHSSGKMGFSLARMAARRGASVTLVAGPVSLKTPMGVNRIDITSAADMAEAVLREAQSADCVIMAAAVADYTPMNTADQKIKKKDGDLAVPLKRTTDILASLGANKKEGQVICGFSMETENLINNSRAKLDKKNADLICANSLRTEGAGYQVDTNIVTILTREETIELPLLSKDDTADRILDVIRERFLR